MCSGKWCDNGSENRVCVSVKPQGCLSVFVYCLNYFSQMLPVIQTVSVCANEYAKKTIKKTLNGHNFLLWLLFFFFFFKLSSKKINNLVNNFHYILLVTIVHIILNGQCVPYNPQQSGSLFYFVSYMIKWLSAPIGPLLQYLKWIVNHGRHDLCPIHTDEMKYSHSKRTNT